MQKNIVRVLFLILFPFLFFQLYFAKKYSEPYPAIVYPSFAGVSKNSKYNKYVTTEIIVNFNNGEKDTLQERSLLGDIPYELRKNLLKKYFLNKKKNFKNQEFTYFLRKRLTEKYKNKTPESITVRWYLNKQYYREDPIRTEKILLESGSINFD